MWILCLLSNMMWKQKTWRRINFPSFLKKKKKSLDSTRGPAQQGPRSRCNEEHMVLAACTQMTNTLTPCAPRLTHRGAFTCSPPPGPLNERTQYTAITGINENRLNKKQLDSIRNNSLPSCGGWKQGVWAHAHSSLPVWCSSPRGHVKNRKQPPQHHLTRSTETRSVTSI